MLLTKHKNYFKKYKSVRFNEPMSRHTTLGIGGRVSVFVEAKSKAKLVKMFNYCQNNQLNFLVIGGGSNLLVSDSDLDLVIIKNSYKKFDSRDKTVVVSGGVRLNELVDYVNKLGLAGLEMLAGIPGTVGGAVYGNAGAYGQSISDNLISVDVINKKGELQNIPKSKCGFAYR